MSIQSIAIVIPCYRSAESIGAVVEEVSEALSDHYQLEFILVNDGCRDGTWAVIEGLFENRQDITAINLRRNFGEHNAVLAGMPFVRHEVAVIIDDDLQHPPSEIRKLVEKMEEGYDVVYGHYVEKQHNLFRNFASWVNDRAATVLLGKPSSLYLSSFKALDGQLVKQIAEYQSPFAYLDGVIFWLTDHVTQVDVVHRNREHGRSNYNLRRLLRLHLNVLTGFSVLPLRLASLLGLTLAIIGALVTVVAAVEKFMNPELQVGWASIVTCVLVCAGMTLTMLGVIGEYVGRIFIVINRRPQSVIREIHRRD